MIKGVSFINSYLQDNNKEMHSTHNEAKTGVAERFIRMLKNKIFTITVKNQKMCILINQMIQVINTITQITKQSK